MLSKLYEKKVDARMQEARDKRSEQKDKLEAQIISKEFSGLTQLVEKWQKLEKQCTELRSAIENAVHATPHVHFSTYGSSKSSPLSLNSTHPELEAFSKADTRLRKEMDEAKDRILTDIWGLTGDYNAILAAIDKEFKTLGV